MVAQPGLYPTWSETEKTGFLTTGLKQSTYNSFGIRQTDGGSPPTVGDKFTVFIHFLHNLFYLFCEVPNFTLLQELLQLKIRHKIPILSLVLGPIGQTQIRMLPEEESNHSVCIFVRHFSTLGEIFFLFSGSRESLPYFSENPNKNKSAFAEFYFPLLLHHFVKIKIKLTFEMKKKHTHKNNYKML